MDGAVPMAGARGQARAGGGVLGQSPPSLHGKGPAWGLAGSRRGVGPGPRAAACRRRPGSFARGFSTPVHTAI